MSTTVSVLICTRDRLPHLRATVNSLSRLEIPTDVRVELVVIDNGSTDGTAEWVEQCDVSGMKVEYVRESRAGTGYARTTAVREAGGDVLVFTDDDVRLPPHWLEVLCRPILAGEVDVVGGSSVLAPERERSWMTDFHRAALSSTDASRLDSRRGPITISMAFSRHVLEKVPAFDPELGPGSRYGFLEDMLFSLQLEAAGFRYRHVTAAPVIHCPAEDRLSRKAFIRAARVRGRSMCYLRYHWQHWDEWTFTHRDYDWQVWRHPWLVVVKRWLHLWTWRLTHVRDVLKDEGIDPVEFALVNVLYQAKQYLAERRRLRNYDPGGLVKRRGVLPTGGSERAAYDSTRRKSASEVE